MKRILIVSFGVFALDQITKFLVVEYLHLKMKLTIDVLSPFVSFRMAWNEGINFGLFGDYDLRWLLIMISILTVLETMYVSLEFSLFG